MATLILKDILIQKKTVILVLFYSILAIFAFQNLTGGPFVITGVAANYILFLTAAAYEDKNKSELMLNSLPVPRKNIVLAKYLSVFVYTAISIVAYFIVSNIFRIFNLPLNIQPITFPGIITIFLLAGCMISIYLPLFFKFGYIQARILNILIFMFFSFGPTLLKDVINKNHKYLGWLVKIFENNPGEYTPFIVLGFTLLFMVISYLISVNIYNHREF